MGYTNERFMFRLAPVLKTFFINVSYHLLVASLTQMALFVASLSLMALFLKQSHQSKSSYKHMI